ncbi:hypothetical protein TCAL_13243 [Tigriopus californicus]|uniref:Cytochrome P450 n=1 Tax=Tigriopus californicus TaxID=6832 RepID=A0A553PSF8_TIGCA|nr:cytochrome P450 6j1-like [Tigriopus californicus]TRY80616.1 hypothetical protein TCAL_13243 [Tigriopus californicus]|eukprot:TCALIF_13243-PA protein Name:"Similar to CYP6J1 Cytochrome P450 6j1 (Blattella germanica)" AED:0.04 eAED:0.04 QI:81/1/0.8/1/1/1/5/28/530
MFTYLTLLLLGAVLYLYLKITKKYGSFKAMGIPEYNPVFPLGSPNHWKLGTGRLNFVNSVDEVYEAFPNEKLVAHFQGGSPQLVVRDLELAKLVLIKDFDHFVDRRGLELTQDTEAQKAMGLMLTMLKGDQWKAIRNTLSPVFTSGKLKGMTPIINKLGQDLVKHLEPFAKSGEEFEAKQVMINFTTDVIAECGFGINAQAMLDPNSVFKQNVMKMSGGPKGSIMSLIRLVMILFLTPLARFLRIKLMNEESLNYFIQVIRQTMATRKESKAKRNDLIDLVLAALRDDGRGPKEVEDAQFERDAQIEVKTPFQSIPEEELELYIVSNAFILFFAGLETSSTIMSVCSVFLATHPDVQERLYREIQDAIDEHGVQEMPYDRIQTLPFLDMVINETLRHYPLAIMERQCVKDYKFPGYDFVVPEGMLVQVPSPAIMKDAKYFPDPLKFNPENFSEANKAKRSPYAFLGFGQGPRNCVGMRFALLQVKIAIIRLVANFEVLPGPNTSDQFRPSPKSPSTQPINGTFIKIVKRH